MKTALALILAGGIVAAQEVAPPAETITPRSRALELAGAFANEGYKIRDGFWSGSLEPGKPLVLQVNLFSGNEYWFSAATLAPAGMLRIGVFDENGLPVQGEDFQDGGTAAAGVIAGASGKYFVRLELAGGDKAEFCLVYSYK